MQKKFFSHSKVIRFRVSVCMCACHCKKSAKTFDLLDRPGWNFQGPLNSSQVIFGLVTRTPGPWPQKMGFLTNLSPPAGFLGQGSCVTLFRNWEDKANKMLGVEFWFLAHSPRKRGRKVWLARGDWLEVPKILEFQHFLSKGPPLKSGGGHFLFHATFWSDVPWGPQGYPWVPEGWKSKVKIGVIFIEGTHSKIKF